MGASIREVAETCGVSTATVSRVFSKHARVKDSTRERVLKAASRLGYAPKLAARQDCLAIVVEGYDAIDLQGYTGMLVAALSREVFQRDCQLEIVRPRDLPLLRGKLITGVTTCVYARRSLDMVAELSGLPVVTVNAQVEGKPAVISNDIQGMRLAVERLAGCGHERIALVRSGSDTLNNVERDRGFVEALEERGLDATLVFNGPASDGGVVELLAKILRQKPTALVVTGEELGPAVAYGLQLLNRHVPNDLSVISFEYRGVSRFTFPPQTTLAQDFSALAKTALDHLAAMRAGETCPERSLVDYQLIERESVSGPPAQ